MVALARSLIASSAQGRRSWHTRELTERGATPAMSVSFSREVARRFPERTADGQTGIALGAFWHVRDNGSAAIDAPIPGRECCETRVLNILERSPRTAAVARSIWRVRSFLDGRGHAAPGHGAGRGRQMPRIHGRSGGWAVSRRFRNRPRPEHLCVHLRLPFLSNAWKAFQNV